MYVELLFISYYLQAPLCDSCSLFLILKYCIFFTSVYFKEFYLHLLHHFVFALVKLKGFIRKMMMMMMLMICIISD